MTATASRSQAARRRKTRSPSFYAPKVLARLQRTAQPSLLGHQSPNAENEPPCSPANGATQLSLLHVGASDGGSSGSVLVAGRQGDRYNPAGIASACVPSTACSAAVCQLVKAGREVAPLLHLPPLPTAPHPPTWPRPAPCPAHQATLTPFPAPACTAPTATLPLAHPHPFHARFQHSPTAGVPRIGPHTRFQRWGYISSMGAHPWMHARPPGFFKALLPPPLPALPQQQQRHTAARPTQH